MRSLAAIGGLLGVLIGLAGLTGNGVRAAEVTIFPDGGLVRIAFDGTLLSTCIGDPKTPLCAYDTWAACRYLMRPELCRAIDLPMTFDRPPIGEPRLAYGAGKFSERVVSIRVMTEADIARLPAPVPWAKTGDVEVRVEYLACPNLLGLRQEPCTDVSEYVEAADLSGVYIFRKYGSWKIISWFNGGDNLECQHVASPFCQYVMLRHDYLTYMQYMFK